MSTVAGMALPQLAASPLLPPATAGLSKGAKAARDFEAQLIGMVMESLEKTFATVPGRDNAGADAEAAGEDNYNYLGTQALASVVAAGGGFGIARMISAHLEQEEARK